MPGPPPARLSDLEDWVAGNRAQLAALGLVWRTGVSPMLGNRPPSAWLDVESRDALGRAVVTEGSCELVVTKRRDGSRTFGVRTAVPTQADVRRALARLVDAVVAAGRDSSDHSGPPGSS
jgi:hypothetical protein